MFPAEVAKQYYEAQRLYSLGKASQALAALDAIDAAAPNHPEVMHARALCLHATGADAEALRLCNLLYTMHRDRRGLDLRNRWTNPRWAADTALAREGSEAAPAPSAASPAPENETPAPPPLTKEFLGQCAVLCIGLHDGPRPDMAASDAEVPARLRTSGCSAADYNAALAQHYEVCLPHASSIVAHAHLLGMPVIHALPGYVCPDGTDLSPYVYARMREDYGPDAGVWPGRPGSREAKPAALLPPDPLDRVLMMTGDDAFTSSNLRFVLRNLAIRHLVVLGGPVETALARSAVTAKQRGFLTLIPADATFALRESDRASGIDDAAPSYPTTTAALLGLMESSSAAEVRG